MYSFSQRKFPTSNTSDQKRHFFGAWYDDGTYIGGGVDFTRNAKKEEKGGRKRRVG